MKHEKEIEEIFRAGKPISEMLQKNFHPHTEVRITTDSVRVEEDIAGCPVKDDGIDIRSL